MELVWAERRDHRRRQDVGQSPADAIAALASVDPCDQANVGLVWAAQQALGLTPDGKWGSGSASAASARGLPGPAGCSPRPGWWAAAGQKNYPTPGSNLPPVPLPGQAAPGQYTAPQITVYGNAPSQDLLGAATNAAAALGADSGYCQSVGRAGTAVNAAVHAFKTAWNAANPGNPVPIGTGKYETSVAAALASVLQGSMPVPTGCSGLPVPMPVPVPTPLDQASQQAAQAQQAAQQAAIAAAKQAAAQQAADVAKQAADQAALIAQQSPSPATKAAAKQAEIAAKQAERAAQVHEEHHGISTGAIVVGAIGVAALVGIVAIAATSGKGKTTTKYKTRKGKTRYITRRAPKNRKHNKSRKRR